MTSSDKQNQQPSDSQLEQAYREAIDNMAPSAELDQKIIQQAHQQVPKARDWAAFPMWARAASVVGVAVLGWWLWQPNLEHDPMTVRHHYETPVEATQAAPESPQQKAYASAEADQRQRLQVESAQREIELASQVKQQADAVEVMKQARQQEQERVAQHKLQQAQRQAEQQQTEQQLKFNFCLQYKLASHTELPQAAALPDDADVSQLTSQPTIEWQQQQWHLLDHQGAGYLVRAEGDGWLLVTIPQADLTICNLHR